MFSLEPGPDSTIFLTVLVKKLENQKTMGDSKNYWYAVHTKPNRENFSELNLRRLGIETFCPRFKQDKIIRRKRQTVTRPLFPGYFFARFILSEQYRMVVYAHGVKNLVAFGYSPVEVDEEIIESIKIRCKDGYVIIKDSSFVPGQVVRIQQGPLQGLEAVFQQELGDHQRAVLLLQTLSYQARITVDLEAVVGC